MTEEINDMHSAGHDRKQPSPDEIHLRNLVADLHSFHKEVPADFLKDATEGLHEAGNSKQLESVLQQLNRQMRNQLGKKKTKRKRRSIGDLSWTYWAIIIILLLAVVGYLVIRMRLHQ